LFHHLSFTIYQICQLPTANRQLFFLALAK
jgi:hypothetical protein